MRRLLLIFAVVAALAVPAGYASLIDPLFQSAYNDLVAWDSQMAAVASNPPPSGHDFAVGSLKVQAIGLPDFQHARFSAHVENGAPATDAKGSVRLTVDSPNTSLGTFDVKGDVDCLLVSSSGAGIDATLREPGPNGETHVRLLALDSGNPGPGMGMSPDQVFWALTSDDPPSNCSGGGVTLGGERSGNIVVHDEP